LYADSLNAIIPAISSDAYKLLGLVMYVLAVLVPGLAHSNVECSSSLIPTVFLPLPFLSYASLLGLVSTVLLIGVVLVDGFSKFEAPGSLWSPATTSFSFCNLEQLGLAFGLFMAGVCNNLAFHDIMCDSKPTHLVRLPRGPPILSSGYG
jgi:solute carrier family 32 (vesicular inhibitory amino acid transporter)